jgi:hypothetical protein
MIYIYIDLIAIGFQYFSSQPVLHYLQAVLFLVKIGTIFKHSLELGGTYTKDHFRWVKVPGTTTD